MMVISSRPLVGDGFAAAKFRMPLMVISLPAVTPPVPVNDRLFTTPLKNDAGNAMAAVFENINVAAPLLTSRFPVVRTGEFPERVNVFAPAMSVPAVTSSVPVTSTSPDKEIPLARVTVKFLTTIRGKLVLGPDPPKTRFDVIPPVKVPAVAAMAPFRVSVFAPM